MNMLLNKYKKGSKKFLNLLEWNVILYDWNLKSIVKYNIFEHALISKELSILYKECNTKEIFAEKLKQLFKYCFKSKCEYEFIISSWPPSNVDDGVKIDVYEQLMYNFDKIVDYLWRD